MQASSSYISPRQWEQFPCTCTEEQAEASMNAKCIGCRNEYEAWSAELEARGVIGPWEPEHAWAGSSQQEEYAWAGSPERQAA